MRKTILAVCVVVLAGVPSAFAQTTAQRVAEDARVIDRVAEASKRDLPAGLLQRIVDEDIELLRGRRADGSYQYASYERLESGRVSESFSIQPRKDEMETNELRGSNIYRIILEVPTRRLLVRKNNQVWVERLDVEYVAHGSSQATVKTFEIKAWMQPGEVRPVDLPSIARQATVKLIATADPKSGYGNIEMSLVQARIVDNADSPYADAVASAKAVQRALTNNDIPSLRATAQRMHDALVGRGSVAVATVPASEIDVVAPQISGAGKAELQQELQAIEDLLTGSESERRQGMDRLHQLLRRVRQ